ncbi:MAG TPA: invasion associated locus B family protein [Rhizomicrobium sp.]|nr:invasion associated locus B family protein [Rhizomicrobium sp.]
MRIAIGVVALILGLLAGWFGHKAMAAEPDVATISVFQDWRLACPKLSDETSSCELQEDVLDARSRSELARISFFKAKDGKQQMIITVPFNVLLQPGLGLQLDSNAKPPGKPTVYPYETCSSVGCLVRVSVDDAFLDKLRDAKDARLLVAGLDGKAVGLPFSLKGFPETLAAYRNNEGKRHSAWSRFWS